MEARIARLESDVGHMRSDLAEVKADVRILRDKMDVTGIRLSERIDNLGARLDDKIDKSNSSLGARIDELNAGLNGLNVRFDGVKDSITAAKTQALLLYVALAGGMFGTMARGFGWI